jgi:Flp pilus assembly pilin Flp
LFSDGEKEVNAIEVGLLLVLVKKLTERVLGG